MGSTRSTTAPVPYRVGDEGNGSEEGAGLVATEGAEGVIRCSRPLDGSVCGGVAPQFPCNSLYSVSLSPITRAPSPYLLSPNHSPDSVHAP